MNKRIKHEIECPYCNTMLGKQGMYGHIRGHHKGMEEDYRTRFPPKMTSLKPKPDPKPKEEPKMNDQIDDILNDEPRLYPVPIKEEPKQEPKPKPEPIIETPKQGPEPEPVVKDSGDKEPKKAKSFLDSIEDLFNFDDII